MQIAACVLFNTKFREANSESQRFQRTRHEINRATSALYGFGVSFSKEQLLTVSNCRLLDIWLGFPFERGCFGILEQS